MRLARNLRSAASKRMHVLTAWFAVAALSLTSAALAQTSFLSPVVRDLSKAVERESAPDRPVLIVPFGFSKTLRAEFTAATKATLVPEAVAKEFFEREKLGPNDFIQPSAIAWIGRQLDAKTVIGGEAKEKGDFFELRVIVVRAIGAETISSKTYHFQKTPALLTALEASGDLPLRRDWEWKPSKTETAPDPNQSPFPCGRDGSKLPQCKFCPNPLFTPEAEQARASSKTIVLLRILVGTDGLVHDVDVRRGAPFGLTGRAIEAVKTWKLMPCRKSDGTPVEARILVESTFRWH